MSSKDKREGEDGAESIEDAVVLPEDGQAEESAAPETSADAAGVVPDPNPGDGAEWVDRGDVAVDVAADAAAEASGTATETGPLPEPEPEPAHASEPAVAPTAAAAAAPAAAPEPQRGGGFMPALLGGLVAGGIGFGAAYLIDPTILGGPEGPDPVETALSAQQERIAALDARLGELSGTVESRLGDVSGTLGGRLDEIAAALEAPAEDPGAAGIETLQQSLSQDLSGISGTLEELGARLTTLEQRPLVESSEAAQAAFDAYEREIAALRAELEEQAAANEGLRQAAEAARAEADERLAALEQEMADRRAAMEQEATDQRAALEQEMAARQAELEERQAALQAEAEEVRASALSEAQEAELREALAKLDVALESGAAFEGVLTALPEGFAVPEALSAHAGSGVASLPALRASYPDLARDALDASIRATVADDATGRLVAFLRSQTGARSLAPREGDDPDAVLSRAEAALRNGELAAAVAELQALPEDGQAVMADWAARAQARLDVMAARESLSAALQAE